MNVRTSCLNTVPVLLLAAATALTGCASTRPVPVMPEPAPAPIRVAGAALPAVAFGNLQLDIPDYRPIGHHHIGPEYRRDFEYRWGPSFRDETDKLNASGEALLQDAGYRVATDDPGALRLVGTFGSFSYDSYDNKESFEQAACEVTWELYRPGETKPFYVERTAGAARIAAGEVGGIMGAFEAAMRRLLATEAFVAAVRGASSG